MVFNTTLLPLQLPSLSASAKTQPVDSVELIKAYILQPGYRTGRFNLVARTTFYVMDK